MIKSTAAITAAVALLSGCNVQDGPAGPPMTESRSVDAGKVEMVRVDLRMAAGELQVMGGSSKLMEGEFRYSGNHSKPEIRYDITGFRGRLNINAGSKGSFGGDTGEDRWRVNLGGGLPIDLHVGMGAGTGELKLAGLLLRSVEVELGAGELTMDLRDNWQKDFDVRIRGGVGEATVYLPRVVGVTAQARGGLGEIKVTGLTKRGSAWVNDLFEKAKTTVRVDVRGGIGQINLIGE